MQRILICLFLFLMTGAAHAQPLETVPQSAGQIQLSFAPLVKRTGPAVVNIYAKKIVKEQMQMISPFMNDPFFRQFFGGQAFNGGVRERTENALGSGVIVDADGVIATNTHVIEGASEINVVLSDGREFPAEKKLVDDKTDLAILHINTKGEKLPFLPMASGDDLQVGDLVLAIGNPFGVGQTVTSGIVSGLARTGVGLSDYGFFIQTDAAINPGNSGGALIDMRGELVGINSTIFSRSGGSIGIGFAIPADMVKTVLDASRKGGKIVRPWTGFDGQTITQDMVESLGLTRAYGVLVNKIKKGSPAETAGLHEGDIIQAIDGHEVRDPQSLQFRMATVPIGTPMKLDIMRARAAQQVTLSAAMPPEIPPREETMIKGRNPFSGATVVNISPAVIEELGNLGDSSGVVVSKAGEGLAAQLGIRQGDVIRRVNNQDISSVGTLMKALSDKAQRWAVQIMRDGKQLSFVISG